MALHTRSPISSTQERIKLGLEAGLLSADEAAQLAHAFLELGDAMTTAVLLLVLATRLEAERGRVRTRDLVELSRSGARAH